MLIQFALQLQKLLLRDIAVDELYHQRFQDLELHMPVGDIFVAHILFLNYPSYHAKIYQSIQIISQNEPVDADDLC